MHQQSNVTPPNVNFIIMYSSNHEVDEILDKEFKRMINKIKEGTNVNLFKIVYKEFMYLFRACMRGSQMMSMKSAQHDMVDSQALCCLPGP
jgi:hypothetical protein